jgi:hypothetical protein
MFKNVLSEYRFVLRRYEKYGADIHGTHDNITRHVCFACQLDKSMDTHWQYVQFIASHRQNLLHNRTTISGL